MADEQKSRLHVHLGGIIIIGIIVLILFKVDIKSKIQSPQFQKNYSYIEEQVKSIWQKYVLDPIKSKTGDFFIDFTNKGVKQIQDNFTKNLLNTTNTQNPQN
jgi:hypothetical protein